MRLLFVTTNVVRWGGSEVLWTDVAEAALDAGHEVMLSVYMHQPWPERIAHLASKGARIHRRPFPSYYREQRFTGRALAEVKLHTGLANTSLDWRMVSRWKPEAVLISSGETFDYVISGDSYIIRYCRKNQVPYYLLSQFNWEHDMDVQEDFRASRRELVKTAAAHFFVASRNFFNAEMQLAEPIPRARVINNPIRFIPPEPLPYPDLPGPMRLASVARLHSFIKGQDLLLQTLAQDIFKGVDFRLSLYGKGTAGEHLQRLISFYGLADKVEMGGHESKLDQIWRENELLVLPSRAEGTSLALLEAMACGRTALVSPAGDSHLWIGSAGFIASSNHVEALTEALQQAFAEREQWKQRGLAARQRLLALADQNPAQSLTEVLTGQRPWDELGYEPREFMRKALA